MSNTAWKPRVNVVDFTTEPLPLHMRYVLTANVGRLQPWSVRLRHRVVRLLDRWFGDARLTSTAQLTVDDIEALTKRMPPIYDRSLDFTPQHDTASA